MFRSRVLGFSLLEAVFAIAFITLITTIFVTSSLHINEQLSDMEHKSESMIAAQQKIDELRLVDPETMPSTLTSDVAEIITVGGNDYSVVVTYCSDSNYCPPTSTTKSRHISLAVSLNGSSIYEVETVFTQLF